MPTPRISKGNGQSKRARTDSIQNIATAAKTGPIAITSAPAVCSAEGAAVTAEEALIIVGVERDAADEEDDAVEDVAGGADFEVELPVEVGFELDVGIVDAG